MLYRHNASDPIIMERPSRAAYAGPSFQKAIASVASAIDGAALNNPAKLFGRKTSASRAKVETANPPMKKRMTYSVTPRPPRGHAVKPASTFPDASGDRHSSKIVDYPRATAAAPTCSPSRSMSCIVDGGAVACDKNGVASFEWRRPAPFTPEQDLHFVLCLAMPMLRPIQPKQTPHACKMGLEGIVSGCLCSGDPRSRGGHD